MRVIHYYPFGYCYPIRSGADHVACNQLDYFRCQRISRSITFSRNYPRRTGLRIDFGKRFGWLNSVTRPRCALGPS